MPVAAIGFPKSRSVLPCTQKSPPPVPFDPSGIVVTCMPETVYVPDADKPFRVTVTEQRQVLTEVVHESEIGLGPRPRVAPTC